MEEPPNQEQSATNAASLGVDPPPTAEQVFEALRRVEDPELGMDVVEIGLIYDVTFDEPDVVKVSFSLTTPACPAGPQIMNDIVTTVRAMPGVRDVLPDLVWDPPWTPDRMSEDAKFILGIG